MRWIVSIPTLTAILSAATCGVGLPTLHAQQPTQASPYQQAQPQPTAQQPQAVALVNGSPITKPELDASVQQRMAALKQTAQSQGQQLASDQIAKVQQEALESLIDSRLVEEYVTSQGPPVEQEEVQAAVKDVKQQLATQQVPYERFLAEQGYTAESFQKRIEGSLAWQKFQQQQMSADKLKAFFEQNRNLFEAEDFQQAQPQVAQTYLASLWSDIVREMKPNAEIKKAGGDGRSSAAGAQPALGSGARQ